MSISNLITPGCRECASKLGLQSQGFTKQGLHLRSEDNRNIYFAPVGNQFNFGHFNDGITPKVVIMGITTSPTARDQFLKDLKILIKSYNLSEAFKRSCIQNIFNSESPTLQRNLNRLLNECNFWKLIGVNNKFNINRDVFSSYFKVDCHDNTKTVLENIYFTQAIFCASCEGTDGSNEPKNIGPEHKACLESQIQFFESFRDKVDLLITFGKTDKLLRKTSNYFSISNKCKEHIPLPHPATARGWNEINAILNSSNQNDLENKIKHISDPKQKGYRTQIINCFKAYQKIKTFVENINS